MSSSASVSDWAWYWRMLPAPMYRHDSTIFSVTVAGEPKMNSLAKSIGRAPDPVCFFAGCDPPCGTEAASMTPDSFTLEAISAAAVVHATRSKTIANTASIRALSFSKYLGLELLGLGVGLADQNLAAHADVVGRAVAADLGRRRPVRVECRPSRVVRLVSGANLVAAAGGIGARLGAVDRHPVPPAGFLARPRHRGHVLEVVVLALVCHELVLVGEVEEVEDLGETRPDLRRRHVDEQELRRDATRRPDLEAPVGEVVERRQLLGEPPRLVERQDIAHDAEPHPRRHLRQCRDQQVGRRAERVEEVVLAEEDALEPVVLELDEPLEVAVEGRLHELLILVVGNLASWDDMELERPRLDAPMLSHEE